MSGAAPQVEIDARVADPGWRKAIRGLDGLTARALSAAANRTGQGGAVSVLFTDDTEMRSLNRQWRGKDKPTDVLSFPASAEMSFEIKHLGDIALGLQTASADAEKLGRGMSGHISHLLVHGFLHLLGYDHETAGDAYVMESLEIEILAGLGLPDPYAPISLKEGPG